MSTQMAIIDFHLHAFPDQLAQRALKNLSAAAGGLDAHCDGTLSGLRALMAADGVSHGVVLNIAVKPSHESSVNRFAIATNSDDIIAFGSVHPMSRHWRDHLRALKEAGIRGVKLHPEYQQFAVDDPHAFPLYQAIAEMGFITVFHAGLDIGFDLPGRCRPAALARVLPAFQGAPVVAAHFGGYMLWDEVERELVGKPVYFDTSGSHGRVLMKQIVRIVRNHGADRVLFGSDAPWSRPALEARLIDHLDIAAADHQSILEGNARRLLGLPPAADNAPALSRTHGGHSRKFADPVPGGST